MSGLEGVTVRRNEKLVRELGPLVSSCLSDPCTEDVLLNPDSTLWVKRTLCDFEMVGRMTRRTLGSKTSAGVVKGLRQ